MSEGRNAAAFEKSLAALRESGRIQAEHEALVTAALSLAEAVDLKPESDALWREYRLGLAALMEAAATDGGNTDGDAEFLDAVRTPMGDASVN